MTGRSGKKNVGAILFACNINAVRSAMAEAMVKVTFPKEIFVDSCGVAPGNPDGFAIAVMAEIGIDMGAHQPKSFDDLDSNFMMSSFPFRPKRMPLLLS
jgi:protein-tyrosine-phosphatase